MSIHVMLNVFLNNKQQKQNCINLLQDDNKFQQNVADSFYNIYINCMTMNYLPKLLITFVYQT